MHARLRHRHRSHSPLTFADLKPRQALHGFTTAAVYLDDADKPLGARFVHDATGFTFDYLRIETAPQGFIWVNSFPTRDMGEPHTQEHLLLGKGNRGRKLGASSRRWRSPSRARSPRSGAPRITSTRSPAATCSGRCSSNHLDALLNPDYTDEEIRREVRNFGVDKADDGKLRLEEKGTVYNEMVRTFESPETSAVADRGRHRLRRAASARVRRRAARPRALRDLTPADIRTFHAANYHLANMGMIGAFPSAMRSTTCCGDRSHCCDREEGGGRPGQRA